MVSSLLGGRLLFPLFATFLLGVVAQNDGIVPLDKVRVARLYTKLLDCINQEVTTVYYDNKPSGRGGNGEMDCLKTGFLKDLQELVEEVAEIEKENLRLNSQIEEIQNETEIYRKGFKKERLVREGEITRLNQTLTEKEAENVVCLQEKNALRNQILKKDRKLAKCSGNVLYFKDEKGNSALHYAVMRNDQQEVKDIVELGADVDAVNDNLETPIHLAATGNDTSNSIKIIMYLGETGANLTATDGQGQTFFHKLISENKTSLTSVQLHDLSEYLVARNASDLFNIQESVFGRTALMLAAKTIEIGNATVALLRSNRVDFTLRDKKGRPWLSYLADGNKNRKLLAGMAGSGAIKYTKLDDAIDALDEEAVIGLVTLGADVGAVSNQSETLLLHKVAGLKDKDFAVRIIKFLIEHGADAFAKDEKNSTFLHKLFDDDIKLSPVQFHDIAAFLISRNLSQLFNAPENVYKVFRTSRSSWGYRQSTPFQLAVKNIEMENATLSLFRNSGVDFNAVNREGHSVLFYAVAGKRSTRLLSALVAHGANPQHLDNYKYSLLHWSAMLGGVEQLQFFVNLGLDINAATGYSKRTPLHLAVQWGWDDDLENVRFLIEKGANIKTKDHLGDSPLDKALKRDDLADKDEIVQLLRDNQ